MTRYLIGFAVGVSLATLVQLPLLLSQRREKYEHGREQGRIDGARMIIEFLDEHFLSRSSMARSPEPIVGSFGFKERSIVVKTRDGVLTLETH